MPLCISKNCRCQYKEHPPRAIRENAHIRRLTEANVTHARRQTLSYIVKDRAEAALMPVRSRTSGSPASMPSISGKSLRKASVSIPYLMIFLPELTERAGCCPAGSGQKQGCLGLYRDS